mmetsp:Transcript_14201/g.29378  ORF Transcript_14201/g.29378 Transcript_14201/m.29378 type:complete len:269 (+) Transcript_14201:927-1733(+)
MLEAPVDIEFVSHPLAHALVLAQIPCRVDAVLDSDFCEFQKYGIVLGDSPKEFVPVDGACVSLQSDLVVDPLKVSKQFVHRVVVGIECDALCHDVANDIDGFHVELRDDAIVCRHLVDNVRRRLNVDAKSVLSILVETSSGDGFDLFHQRIYILGRDIEKDNGAKPKDGDKLRGTAGIELCDHAQAFPHLANPLVTKDLRDDSGQINRSSDLDGNHRIRPAAGNSHVVWKEVVDKDSPCVWFLLFGKGFASYRGFDHCCESSSFLRDA